MIGSRARGPAVNGRPRQAQFDAIWVSSLTSSAAQGLPDTEMYLIERRLDVVREICFASLKPVIVDADTGGDVANLSYLIHRLEDAGASAVVIEDKRWPKRNSLSSARHMMERPAAFVQKIRRAKAAATSMEMLIFARLESLNAGLPVSDALERAALYEAAGADGIMIHSRAPDPDEVFEFIAKFNRVERSGRRPYLMCVPTTYNSVSATDLFRRGVNIVIYANHLLRAAHLAMYRVCDGILANDRSFEIESLCSPVSTLLDEVAHSEVVVEDLAFSGAG